MDHRDFSKYGLATATGGLAMFASVFPYPVQIACVLLSVFLLFWCLSLLWMEKTDLTVVDLLKKARKAGWRFDQIETAHVYDFQNALKQSAFEGKITFKGRKTEDLALLRKIPAEFWKDNEPYIGCYKQPLGATVYNFVEDNFLVSATGYKDLHVCGVNSLWIKLALNTYAGKMKAISDERAREQERLTKPRSDHSNNAEHAAQAS